MADKVRAKFFVQEVGNKAWASATPSGQITMTIRNDLALEFFDVGDEFFVDFTRAEKGVEGMEATPA